MTIFWIVFAICAVIGVVAWFALEMLSRMGASGEPPPTNSAVVLIVIGVISALLALAVKGLFGG